MASANIKCNRMLKLVAVGDTNHVTGKTALLTKYVDNECPGEHITSVFDNVPKLVQFEDKLINLSLWDTTGNEDYARLRPLSYPHTDVFLVVFSLASAVSLKNVSQKWVPELMRYISKYNSEHGTTRVPAIVLAGNNKHIWDKARVPESAIMEVVHGSDMIYSYQLCSHYTGEGVDEVFLEATWAALLSLKHLSKEEREMAIAKRAAQQRAQKLKELEQRRFQQYVRENAPRTLRQWSRIIGMPERVLATARVSARGPQKRLIDFFVARPGLRRLVGGLMLRYFDAITTDPHPMCGSIPAHDRLGRDPTLCNML